MPLHESNTMAPILLTIFMALQPIFHAKKISNFYMQHSIMTRKSMMTDIFY
ncbi:hypothetical protein WL1483_3463 [Aeromonas schubertii]|uniref:Uncharacterized protein n=1 Tax=Aeromonas schubertii TaxID=652 RepID=A0A0S2SMK1_9GAMM|nr:hypothetical protein WL1483_3463 [Aeromonas schubertii]